VSALSDEAGPYRFFPLHASLNTALKNLNSEEFKGILKGSPMPDRNCRSYKNNKGISSLMALLHEEKETILKNQNRKVVQY